MEPGTRKAVAQLHVMQPALPGSGQIGLRFKGRKRQVQLRLGRGTRRFAAGDLGEGKEPSLLQRRSASSLCAHACGRCAGLQHPMQLLQPQVRLFE